MEVVVPVVAADFIFDSASTTPYVSAPSSPRPLGSEWPSSRHYYTSAPSSPTRATAIFRDFSAAMASGLASPRPSSHRSSVIPFEWEDAPGTPKSLNGAEEEEHAMGQVEVEGDFAFEFSGQLEIGGSSPLTADELFEEGMIRPLKPPPRLQYPPPVARAAAASEKGSALSPRSPKSPKSPRSPRSLFGRWRKQDDFDPFARAIEETTRGRDRANPPGHPAGQARRAARSLSPLRMGADFGQHGHNSPAAAPPVAGASTGAAAAAAPTSGAAAAAAKWIKGGSKKWRLRDLLLFRSASEGRATGSGARDPLRKYTALSPSSSAMLSRKSSAASISSVGGGGGEDTRNASFRSTDSGSVGGSSRRGGGGGGGGGGSAHGRRYAEASRAAAEEMRRRTMLPYRQGLFGCLGFNPAINGLARGFSRTRS